ncbi:aspartate kinase [Candidatus Mesenet endosymbiont of Agriotes lineatus]|uniref:aspartate kinase n=1 Tax=Candidatus Mesenet endosymbiont of Agriotes lineatus TaxID=3077948 RepID=UPI0030CF222C
MILVKKFGGTSVADLNCILHVAKLIKDDVDKGKSVIAVVSAMASFTNEMISKITQLSNLSYSQEELSERDVVLSAGEQISCGFLTLALESLGIKAKSWLGWQISINTDDAYGKARIKDIQVDKLKASFKNYSVAIVAGFQGVHNNRITTLGRGGSDTSAIAIAAALGAKICEIYTDVDGIYTADPNVVSKARKLDSISYEEMLEMSSLGAKVLQIRCVELAMKYNIKINILSTFAQSKGTLLLSKEEVVERNLITGITCDVHEASVTLKKVPFGFLPVFELIAKANINVDMISQNMNNEKNDITFTIQRTDVSQTKNLLKENKDKILYDSLSIDESVAKVSIIGVGMLSHSGVAYQMFKTLNEKGINILAITTSEIKISVLIPEDYAELAVRALHTVYDLDSSESIS